MEKSDSNKRDFWQIIHRSIAQRNKMKKLVKVTKSFKIKIIVAFIAALGWGYQTFLLSVDYFSFRTMTRLDYETQDVIEMPAIWMCFSGHIPYRVRHFYFFSIF